MAADEPDARRPGGDADPPQRTNVQNAIEWFSTDHSRTRQVIDHPEGPIKPGRLLYLAQTELQGNQLLDGTADQARALVRAQAAWLIRRMPSDHDPLSLDSAQQAGRAWAILITAGTNVLPDQNVLTEVAVQTRISVRVADAIRELARITHDAFNRADLLFPYDDAKDKVLVDDWNRLAACGPELPEAAKPAQDILYLLTARVTGTDDHGWMNAAAQHAAQVYASVMSAQPLLADLAALIPHHGGPDIAADQARLVENAEQSHLSTAATAAARAQAVKEWADLNGTAEPDRTRIVEAAVPGMRTLGRLNRTLAALDPVHGQATLIALDPDRIAQIAEAIGQLSRRMRAALRTSSLPATMEQHRTPQRPQHQQPPTPRQNPGGATPGPAL